MPQKVDIPNVGRVYFPDEMTAEQIQAAIEQDILARRPVTREEPVPFEGPSTLARVGRGASDVSQGLGQRILQGVGALPQATPSIQELRAYANPEEQKLSDDELRARFQQQDPAANYTERVNDELGLYEKGRATQGGGLDLARIAGNIGATAPLALIPGGKTFMARAGSGAVQGGAAGVAQFAPSGGAKETALNTGTGAVVGGVVAPIAGWAGDKALKVGQKIAGWWRGVKAGQASVDDLMRAVPELGELPEAAQRDLITEAHEQIAKTGTLNAEELGRKANLIAQGVKPTKSMVTRDPADWTLERNLQKLAQSPDDELSKVGRELTDVYQANDKALTGRLAELGKNLPKGTSEAQGMTVMQSLDDLAKSSQEEVGKIYESVRSARGEQLASDARNLASTLDDLRDSTYAEKLVSSVTNKLRRFGMLDPDGNLTAKTLTVSQAEELRKFVNKLPNDFGKQDVIRAIDADVVSGLGDDAFSAARSAAKSRFATLENPATQRALNTLGELQQGKTAQNFIKSQVIDAAEQDVESLMETLGKLPSAKQAEAVDALRAGVLSYLEDAAGSPNSGKFSGAALNKAVERIGEKKLVAVLGMPQYAKLKDLARASLDATFEPPYSAVNYSGTAPMLMSLTQRARAIPGVPLIVNENVEKLAAQSGYQKQLAQALAARSQGQLPPISANARDLVQALTAASAPGSAAALNQERQRANQKARKRQ